MDKLKFNIIQANHDMTRGPVNQQTGYFTPKKQTIISKIGEFEIDDKHEMYKILKIIDDKLDILLEVE